MEKRLIIWAMVYCVIASPVIAPETTSQVAESPYGFALIPHQVLELDSVVKIRCGDSEGTGVQYSADLLLTASHVLQGECHLQNGSVGEVIHNDAVLDYAILHFSHGLSPHVARLDCNGFQPEQVYFSFGWELGERFVSNPMVSSGLHRDGYHVLLGRLVPGMSGGPIITSKGEVVGINNLTNWEEETNHGSMGLSRELTDTVLCE